MQIPFRKSEKGLILSVRVNPRSSKKGISGVIGNTVHVKLTAPPVEGAANEQLIDVLSEALGIKKKNIKIVRGGSSRDKTVQIQGHDFLLKSPSHQG